MTWRPWLSMPCNGCSHQVQRLADLCESNDDPLCPTCCNQLHDGGQH